LFLQLLYHYYSHQEGPDPRYIQVATTIKHFDAYSLEDADGYTRYDFNAIVSDYDLADTYLPAFKMAVTEGQAQGLMCSYNAVNGIPTCASPFLRDALHTDWGFTGYVTSDTDAVANIFDSHHYTASYPAAACAALVQGQTDINSGGTYYDYLLAGAQAGLCNMTDIDSALRRSMRVRFRLGLFDPVDDQYYWKVPPVSLKRILNVALVFVGLFSLLLYFCLFFIIIFIYYYYYYYYFSHHYILDNCF
jgi:beta-D-xylosidase 4